MHWPRKIRWSVDDEFDRTWKETVVANFKSVPMICLGDLRGTERNLWGRTVTGPRYEPPTYRIRSIRSRCSVIPQTVRHIWSVWGSLPWSLSPVPGLSQVGRNRQETYNSVDQKQLLMKRRSWVQLPGIQGIRAVNCCHERRQPDCSGCASTERHSVLWCIRSRRR
jgi:hypothetical protein